MFSSSAVIFGDVHKYAPIEMGTQFNFFYIFEILEYVLKYVGTLLRVCLNYGE